MAADPAGGTDPLGPADPEEAVRAELDRLAGALPALGLAVSGGSDSTALLHIAAPWAQARGVRLAVATVDHRLRPGSGDEAAAVARASAALGVPHRALVWDHAGRAPAGNLMAAARAARLRLLADWADGAELGAVALGHTMDDQAETLVMRLGRGAGLDGLSGMAAARRQGGTLWLRPMLGVRRAALRDWLTARGLGWSDDPTNDDAGFDRVRVRQAIAALDLPVPGLARSAAWLSEARAALTDHAATVAEGVEADRGMLLLPPAVLAQPAETRRRLIAAGLRWVTGADYAPRGDDLSRLLVALAAGAPATLAGVIARPRADGVALLREPAAAARAPAAEAGADGSAVWDDRWRLLGLPPGARVTATTPAALAARDWRGAGLPRVALLAAPAVEAGGRTLLPLLDPGAGVTATPLRGRADWLAILRAH